MLSIALCLRTSFQSNIQTLAVSDEKYAGHQQNIEMTPLDIDNARSNFVLAMTVHRWSYYEKCDASVWFQPSN